MVGQGAKRVHAGHAEMPADWSCRPPEEPAIERCWCPPAISGEHLTVNAVFDVRSQSLASTGSMMELMLPSHLAIRQSRPKA